MVTSLSTRAHSHSGRGLSKPPSSLVQPTVPNLPNPGPLALLHQTHFGNPLRLHGNKENTVGSSRCIWDQRGTPLTLQFPSSHLAGPGSPHGPSGLGFCLWSVQPRLFYLSVRRLMIITVMVKGTLFFLGGFWRSSYWGKVSKPFILS